MKHKIVDSAIIVLSVLLMSAPIVAETKYVSDEFEIMLRRGQTVQHEIIRQLKSGTPVKVLESNAKYSLVRTNSGAEGWVLTRYLMDQPAGRERAIQYKADYELLKNNFDALLAKQKSDLEQELAELQVLAKKPITLEKRNTELQGRLAQQKQRYQTLEQETEALRMPYKDREWLITGAGVFFVGLVVGMILVSIGRRKRRWNQL
jgi:SH3 domain protein